MEPVLSASDETAALAEAVEALRRRILADPPPSSDEVREALDIIGSMALALWGEPDEGAG